VRIQTREIRHEAIVGEATDPCSATTSETRSPAPYAVANAALYFGPEGGFLSRAENCRTFDARDRTPRPSRAMAHYPVENAPTATRAPSRASGFVPRRIPDSRVVHSRSTAAFRENFVKADDAPSHLIISLDLLASPTGFEPVLPP
jgi:hypothetical protein